MTLEAIRRVRTAQPWAPFTLRLADGRSLKVTHPESLAIPSGDKGRTIVHVGPNDDIRMIDLLLVVEIMKSNGHSGSRRRAG